MGDLAGRPQMPVCKYCGFDLVKFAGAEARAANRRRPGTDDFGGIGRRVRNTCRAAVVAAAIGR